MNARFWLRLPLFWVIAWLLMLLGGVVHAHALPVLEAFSFNTACVLTMLLVVTLVLVQFYTQGE